MDTVAEDDTSTMDTDAKEDTSIIEYEQSYGGAGLYKEMLSHCFPF